MKYSLMVALLLTVFVSLLLLNREDSSNPNAEVGVVTKQNEIIDKFSNDTDTEAMLLDALTFSNTQEWGQEYLNLIQSIATTTRIRLLSQIAIPTPPANSSTTTKAELALLQQYALERTPATVAAIIAEDTFTPELAFGPITFGDFLLTEKRIKTRRLFDELLRLYGPVVMSLKQTYNRVRPHQLDQTLTTVIDVPPHAAYPSGHSSQAFAAAYYMSALDPTNTDAYMKRAEEIARNREVAGLHYPSDTEAGRLLAQQFFILSQEDPYFKHLLAEAKTEWTD